MRLFFIFSTFYTSAAVIIVPLFIVDGMSGIVAVSNSAKILWSIANFFLIGILVALVIIVVTVDRLELRARSLAIIYAIFGTILLQAGFSMFKNVLSFVAPYFADPFMANVDRALHFGADPGVLVHKLSEFLPTDLMLYTYMSAWVLPAFSLPIIIAATDANRERIVRTMTLYVVAWVFVGNILAFAGLSVGPVYYDRLLGGVRFADLTMALQESGVVSSDVGKVQQALWDVYSGKSAAIGGGISAFPSVHVSVATVAAIYMSERSKLLFPVAAAFLLMILVFSVYTGYHYAVDGYASILIIFALWWWLKRRAGQE